MVVENLERRINHIELRRDFFATVKENGKFLKFNESTSEHEYLVSIDSQELAHFLRKGLLLEHVYTFIVAIRNGVVRILKMID